MLLSGARPTWTHGTLHFSPGGSRVPAICTKSPWRPGQPPPAGAPRPSDLLLDGLTVLVTEGRVEAAPLLSRAARVFAEEEITIDDGLR
jgi:hypothetical protein